MRKFRPAASTDAGVERVSAPRPHLRKLARKPAPPRPAKPQRDRRPILAFPSLKAGCLIGVGRYWLADLLALLETDPEVVSYARGTAAVTFDLGGEERTFRPDLEVVERTGRIAVAALTAAEAVLDENVAAAVALTALYARRGVRFRVVTDEELKAQPRLDNAKLLLRHQRIPVPPDASMRLAAAVADGRAATLGDLHAALGADDGAWAAVLSLVAQGLVLVPMDARIAADSRVLAVLGDGRRA